MCAGKTPPAAHSPHRHTPADPAPSPLPLPLFPLPLPLSGRRPAAFGGVYFRTFLPIPRLFDPGYSKSAPQARAFHQCPANGREIEGARRLKELWGSHHGAAKKGEGKEMRSGVAGFGGVRVTVRVDRITRPSLRRRTGLDAPIHDPLRPSLRLRASLLYCSLYPK